MMFLGMLTEVRRMLLIPHGWRARRRSRPSDSRAFETRGSAPGRAGGAVRAIAVRKQGAVKPYLWFKAATRAARYSTPESPARSGPGMDVRMSPPSAPLDALSVYVAQLIAGT
jgi:hypothetical protein